ncbi:DnaB family ATPase, partial [Pseudomonas aeruginosa]|uniref:DnaB family ATPase n=1 Tax=Pseudomonas aeruginosa TaxID=287 RepID=UPI003968B65A
SYASRGAVGVWDALKRGEFIIGGGLQHQYKSGVSMSLFCHVCLFNKPYMRDINKKPLVMIITIGNEVTCNLIFIYEYI